MIESDQYPQLDLYEIQHAEKSGNTFKPVLGGIILIVINITIFLFFWFTGGGWSSLIGLHPFSWTL